MSIKPKPVNTALPPTNRGIGFGGWVKRILLIVIACFVAFHVIVAALLVVWKTQPINNSMFTDDPNHVPTYADGTVIRQQDLADMNMNGLQRIAEMIGIELGE